MKIKALFLSDIHLGSRGCDSESALEVLKMYEPQTLYLVGDIIDGWLLKRRIHWKQKDTNLIRKILSYSKKGTKIIYITGNHDDFLREYSPIDFGENIILTNESSYGEYWVTHGDLYDGVVKLKWLGKLGAWGYETAIGIDIFLKKLGYKKSLSYWLKSKVKRAITFIQAYEKQLSYQAKKRGYRGVICGHIHKPEGRQIIVEGDLLEYWNCGDWLENKSYIVDRGNGLELKYFEEGIDID